MSLVKCIAYVLGVGLFFQGWLLHYLLTDLRPRALCRRSYREDIFLRAVMRRHNRMMNAFYAATWESLERYNPTSQEFGNYDFVVGE